LANFHGFLIDGFCFMGKVVGPQLNGIGPVGVGFQGLGPGLEVFLVDVQNHLRLGQADFLKTFFKVDPFD
jgi:hypothetical protein